MVTALNIEDHDALKSYLVRNHYLSRDEPVTITNLQGGVSNRTVLVRREHGPSWVIKQALPKLRVAVDWYSDPARIQREALGLRWLSQYVPDGAIPELVFADASRFMLGMVAVPPGHINWKTLLLAGNVDLEHIRQYAQILGQIHRQAYLDREHARPVFADQTFFVSLRLEPYYRYTAEQHTDARAFYETLIADMQANNHTLVHGDYSPKNILVYDGRLILLDHEVIHFGDPAFDLGFSLTHLLSKAHHVVQARAALADAAIVYWQTYQETVGDVPWVGQLEERSARHALGCLLARVDGRSPLEYLSPQERDNQRAAVLQLLSEPLVTIESLVSAFLERI